MKFRILIKRKSHTNKRLAKLIMASSFRFAELVTEVMLSVIQLYVSLYPFLYISIYKKLTNQPMK